MVMSEIEAGQGGFVMVQRKTFIPKGNPVIVVEGESEFVIVPPPEINDQLPTPTVALLAAIKAVGVVIQTV